MRLAADLWKSRREHRNGDVRAGRQAMLENIDPTCASVAPRNQKEVPTVGQLLLFTDSTVSIFAGRKTYSNSPELQAILDEIEILLMETGLVACFKHLPGKAMIRVHVDAASRRDAGPLLRVRDALEIHPYVLHEWGVTAHLRDMVSRTHPEVVFVGDDDGMEWSELNGRTFCFCAYPETLVPSAMRALDIWTSRPWSTTIIMLVARDFGTPGIRPILRQFDEVAPGQRFRRILGEGGRCIWDTLMAVKGPLAGPKVSSSNVAERHRELMAIASLTPKQGRSRGNGRTRKGPQEDHDSSSKLRLPRSFRTATKGGEPIGAEVA
jgi:hypothetical protein